VVLFVLEVDRDQVHQRHELLIGQSSPLLVEGELIEVENSAVLGARELHQAIDVPEGRGRPATHRARGEDLRVEGP